MRAIKAAWHCDVDFGAVIVDILLPLLSEYFESESQHHIQSTLTSVIVNLQLQCVWIISSLTASQLFQLGCKLEFIFHSIHCFAAASFSNVWHFKNSLIYSAMLYFTICRGIVNNNRKWKFDFQTMKLKDFHFTEVCLIKISMERDFNLNSKYNEQQWPYCDWTAIIYSSFVPDDNKTPF